MPRLNTRVVTAAKLVAILLLFGVSVFGQNGFTNIAFTVSMPRPHTHLFEVDVSIKREGLVAVPAEELLVMPVWTPGSYLVREFERHVQDFAATDATGQQLKWEKINKNTWRVVTNRSRDWRATYKVYANELSVRTSELNSSHAYWNNANLLMYLEGFLTSPSTVRVVAPDVWKVATGLPGVPGQRNTFRAENFDVLYDSPFEVSNFKSILFNVKGIPHRIVTDGEGNYDPERMRFRWFAKRWCNFGAALRGGGRASLSLFALGRIARVFSCLERESDPSGPAWSSRVHERKVHEASVGCRGANGLRCGSDVSPP